jgi:hypothetical protein
MPAYRVCWLTDKQERQLPESKVVCAISEGKLSTKSMDTVTLCS